MSEQSPQAGGRRDNGLPAREWGALVDLDPRLSPALLERLAAADVPAYVEPAGGTVDSVSRAVSLPNRPLDRLWVDPSRADEARTVVTAEAADLTSLLAEETPGANAHGLIQAVPRDAAARVLSPPQLPQRTGQPAPPPVPAPGTQLDQDEEFQRLVDSLSEGDAEPTPAWPDVPAEQAAGRPEPDEDLEPGELPGWLEPDALPDEGHYEPPIPAPVPRPGRRVVAAAAIVVLGLILVFAPGLLAQPSTTGSLLLGIVILAGGSVALIWQMRDAPRDHDGPDDGAVV